MASLQSDRACTLFPNFNMPLFVSHILSNLEAWTYIFFNDEGWGVEKTWLMTLETEEDGLVNAELHENFFEHMVAKQTFWFIISIYVKDRVK